LTRAVSTFAFHGLAGEVVRLIEPETEADPNILLILFLVIAGSMFGRRAWFRRSAQRHYPNLFVAVVGRTSKGRKGTATAAIKFFFDAVDHAFIKKKWVSGMSSSEGLIDEIHDPRYMRTKIPDSKPPEFEDREVDPGVGDKRLLVNEGELAGPLAAMQRDGNKLSETIRDAFDSNDLRSMTKRDKTSASNPHISIIGNITPQELSMQMKTVNMFNGFANRFLWAASERSKTLPEDGDWEKLERSAAFGDLVKQFRDVYETTTVANDPYDIGGGSKVTGEIALSDEAQEIWGRNGDDGGMYANLEIEKHGMHEIITQRAPVMVLRLALVYCLLDGCNEITADHIMAAGDVWRYCDDSARLFFNGRDDLGNPHATKILRLIQKAQVEGRDVSRTEVSKLFSNNVDADTIGSAIELLLANKKITVNKVLGTRLTTYRAA
jgi:hypothetical protein